MAVLKKASGLSTYGSEINEKEGALDIADNVVIDADNIIESRRGLGEFGNTFGTTFDRLKQVTTYKDRILRHYNSTLEVDTTGEGNFVPYSGDFDELVDGLRIKSQESNGNFFFTTNDGIKKISAKNAQQLSTSPVTESGGAKALDVTADLLFATGGFLPPQAKCAYRVVWGTKDNNNNLILGTPSARTVLTNNSADVDNAESFEMTFGSGSTSDYDGSTADRYVTFSSSLVDYFIWFSTLANTTAPQTTDTVGRTAIEVDIEGLTLSSAIAVATASKLSATLSAEFKTEVSGSTLTVTSLEPGEDLIDAESSISLVSLTTTVLEQGSISTGGFANATINVVVPSTVTSTDYFYQLYRTASIEVTEGITLESLEPGDEMNLAFEANITQAEITAGTLTFEDITTDLFRDSGTFLYTNPNTGAGILQANERPPVAQDIELFRNSVFYSNTQTAHRLTLNMLSVADFTSGITSLIIGNSTQDTEYTFVGDTEISEITTDSYANTDDTGYILINSARNERKYYIWFDKGTTTDPQVPNRTGLRMKIESGQDDITIASNMVTALNFLADFNATSVGAIVTISHIKNGNTDDISIGSPLTNNWAVSVATQGDGEDSSINEVLLSSEASVGLSIDETARSLVRIVNLDSSSPVNAFYLSGVNDLPGIILFEAKSLDDDPFFIATSDPAVTSKFNPELPTTEGITAISADNPTEISSAGHGLFTGDTVVIQNTDSTPAIQGQYTVTVLDSNTFTVPVEVLIAGTNGIWFKSDTSSDNEKSPNRIFYSKLGQPESVPIVNYLDIGPRDQSIQRILALRDNLFVLKEDGVYIVTGTSAPDFGARLLDGSTEILAPDSAVILNNKIYALTTQGVVTITEGGVSIISRPIEDKILGIANTRFNFTYTSFGVSYESDRAYILWMPTVEEDTVATQAFRFNTFTRTWTRWTTTATCGIVNTGNDVLYVGGDRNVLDQERKNGDRTDYTDRDFELAVLAGASGEDKLDLNTTLDVQQGDVIVQTQYLTIAQFNRIVRKLDLDGGLTDTDYSLLQAVAGDSLNVKMDALNIKLVADDSSGNITPRVHSVDFETLQSEFNLLINELNLLTSDTIYKDYEISEGTIPYEAIILSKVDLTNQVTLNASLPIIPGPIRAYKAISTVIQWVPQHFGASDVLKQVREGTVIFDQNNFYSGIVSYASDRSFNFESIPFRSRGVGFFGGNEWGESTWGGQGNEIPVRTLIPREKQRCRHIRVKFQHNNAREIFKVLGISLEPRALSKRAYR